MTGRLPFVLLVCVLCVSAASAQQQISVDYRDESAMPSGIEGERIQLLFDAVNTGDVDLATRFYNESFAEESKAELPLDAFIDEFQSIIRQTGGADFHSVRVYDPPRDSHTIVIFKDRNTESWQAFVLAYAEGTKPEGLLTSLGVSRARTPSDVEREGPLTEGEAVAEIRTYVDRLCEHDLFSGTVLLAKGDEVLLEMYCGEASKRFHAPVNMDTKFNIGSMNKMFTSIAVMQLVEKGVLSVDDPIGKYVDETWLPREITDKIRIRHLLSHTSGLGSYFNETFDAGSRRRWRELDDYKELVQGDTLAFEPGTDGLYSNTGMFMLGVVIESATGINYFDYIRENVYAPAVMQNTDCYDMDCPVENLAIGYWPSTECSFGWKNNYYEHVIRGGPAGGGFSTAGDLYRFGRALQTGRLVAPETAETMWADQSGPEIGASYGYGFGIRLGPSGKVVGHNGGFTGISANLDMFLDSGYIAVVLANYGGVAMLVQTRIAEVLARVE